MFMKNENKSDEKNVTRRNKIIELKNNKKRVDPLEKLYSLLNKNYESQERLIRVIYVLTLLTAVLIVLTAVLIFK